MKNCPCNEAVNYEDCCMPYHDGAKFAETAETLMRARYSAFAKQKVQYIVDTHIEESRDEINPQEIEAWSKSSDWKGLDIIDTENGSPKDKEGIVEFKAIYESKGSKITHHERASFSKKADQWYFVDGKVFNEAIRRSAPKVGRNDPCSCGSGKKFKKCCLLKE